MNSGRRILISYIIIDFLLLSSISLNTAVGYVVFSEIGYWGPQLDDGVLTYHLDYNYNNDMDVEASHIIYKAFMGWESKLEGYIRFSEIMNKDKADIIMKFGHLNDTDKMDHNYVGRAEQGVEENNEIEYVEITMIPLQDIEKMISPRESIKDIYMDALEHELGHVLLLGHSSEESDLMSAKENGEESPITKCHAEAVLYINGFTNNFSRC